MWGGSGSLLPGKADWSQTARLQGSRTLQGWTALGVRGGGGGWGGGGRWGWGWGWGAVLHAFPAASRPPASPQSHLPNSLHYYFTQGTPVLAHRAGKKPGGASEEKGGRRGRKGGSGGITMQEVFANPHGLHPHPFPGQNPYSTSPRSPAGSSRNSPLRQSPLNKTIRSKTRRQDCSWNHPSLPLPPESQFCKSAAAKSEPVIFFR